MTALVCPCGLRFANTVDLQLHRMDCSNHQVERRRSGRKRKLTSKGKSYSQRLHDKGKGDDSSCSETEENQSIKSNEERKVKSIEDGMEQLSLVDIVVEESEEEYAIKDPHIEDEAKQTPQGPKIEGMMLSQAVNLAH